MDNNKTCNLDIRVRFWYVMLLACSVTFGLLSVKIVIQFAQNQTVSKYSTLPLGNLAHMPTLSICIPYKPGLTSLPLIIEIYNAEDKNGK